MKAREEKVQRKHQGDDIHEGTDVPELSGKGFYEDIADQRLMPFAAGCITPASPSFSSSNNHASPGLCLCNTVQEPRSV